MMSRQADSVSRFLNGFGLSEAEANLYTHLLGAGSRSALQLARETKLARTKVYRLIESLEGRGLVQKELGERGARWEATSPSVFDELLDERISKFEDMKDAVPNVVSELSSLVGKSQVNDNKSRVLYYKGLEGLKQVTWNSLRADGELLLYEIGNLDSFIPSKKYNERLRLEFVRNKIRTRTLTNIKKCDAWTNVTQMVEKYWEIRHVPKNTLSITSEILIYNNVYVMYRYEEGDIFCIEIHNKQLADMQRQVFELLWSSARKFKTLSPRGKAELA